MPSKTSRTGICLIRIEVQQRGVLITLRTNHDVTQVSTERVQVAADLEEAVAAVRAFLVEFIATSTDGRVSEPG